MATSTALAMERTRLTRSFASDLCRRSATEAIAVLERLGWERYEPRRKQDPFAAKERDELLAYFRQKRHFEEYVSLRLRFAGVTPSEVRGLHVGDFDRATDTVSIVRSSYLGAEGATKTRARERVVSLGEAARDISTLCGLRDPGEALLVVPEDTLRDNFTKAQKALGFRHRSLYQAKHTFAVLSLLAGESPALVARNLGISLATMEKPLRGGASEGPDNRHGERCARVGNATENARAVSGGASTRDQKRPRRDFTRMRTDALLDPPGQGGRVTYRSARGSQRCMSSTRTDSRGGRSP